MYPTAQLTPFGPYCGEGHPEKVQITQENEKVVLKPRIKPDFLLPPKWVVSSVFWWKMNPLISVHDQLDRASSLEIADIDLLQYDVSGEVVDDQLMEFRRCNSSGSRAYSDFCDQIICSIASQETVCSVVSVRSQ